MQNWRQEASLCSIFLKMLIWNGNLHIFTHVTLEFFFCSCLNRGKKQTKKPVPRRWVTCSHGYIPLLTGCALAKLYIKHYTRVHSSEKWVNLDVYHWHLKNMLNLKLSHDFRSFTLPKLQPSSFIEKCKFNQVWKRLWYRTLVLYIKQAIFLT